MTAPLSLKSRASNDMIPFNLCNKKRLAIQHMNRPLSNDTIVSVLQHQEVSRAKDLSAHPHNSVFPSSLLHACYMPHIYHLPSYDYVNNILCTVSDMKLSTVSSAPLYSHLPLTSNVLLTTLLSQTLNLYSSLDIRHQITHPHKMTQNPLKPDISLPPRKDIRHDSLQEIHFYRTSREITIFREDF